MHSIQERTDIIKAYKSNHTYPVDICITTYQRLEYLKKCIWSIVASTKMKHRIFVLNDDPKDKETALWLKDMSNRGLVHYRETVKENMGTANALNHIISKSESDFFVLSNDDIYFHQGWDITCLDIINRIGNCASLSFYNIPKPFIKGASVDMGSIIKRANSGLGASFTYRKVFDDIGGFQLESDKKMGFFSGDFKEAIIHSENKRNEIYCLKNRLAVHMDHPECKLNERALYDKTGYNQRRSDFKNNKAKDNG